MVRAQAPLALAAAVLLAGCAWLVRSQAFPYDDVERPARPSDTPIPIIADTSAISRPYIVIGMVRAGPGDLGGVGEGGMLEGLRREARKMGGDALIGLRRQPTKGSGRATHIELKPIDPASRRRESMPYDYVAEVITYDVSGKEGPSSSP